MKRLHQLSCSILAVVAMVFATSCGGDKHEDLLPPPTGGGNTNPSGAKAPVVATSQPYFTVKHQDHLTAPWTSDSVVTIQGTTGRSGTIELGPFTNTTMTDQTTTVVDVPVSYVSNGATKSMTVQVTVKTWSQNRCRMEAYGIHELKKNRSCVWDTVTGTPIGDWIEWTFPPTTRQLIVDGSGYTNGVFQPAPSWGLLIQDGLLAFRNGPPPPMSSVVHYLTMETSGYTEWWFSTDNLGRRIKHESKFE